MSNFYRCPDNCFPPLTPELAGKIALCAAAVIDGIDWDNDYQSSQMIELSWATADRDVDIEIHRPYTWYKEGDSTIFEWRHPICWSPFYKRLLAVFFWIDSEDM